MDHYTFNEYAVLHLTYGVVRESGRKAAQMYAESLPNQRKPQHRMFARVL